MSDLELFEGLIRIQNRFGSTRLDLNIDLTCNSRVDPQEWRAPSSQAVMRPNQIIQTFLILSHTAKGLIRPTVHENVILFFSGMACTAKVYNLWCTVQCPLSRKAVIRLNKIIQTFLTLSHAAKGLLRPTVQDNIILFFSGMACSVHCPDRPYWGLIKTIKHFNPFTHGERSTPTYSTCKYYIVLLGYGVQCPVMRPNQIIQTFLTLSHTVNSLLRPICLLIYHCEDICIF
jgi:hypothetical protein